MKTRHQAAIDKEQVTPGPCKEKHCSLLQPAQSGQNFGGKFNLQQQGTSFRYEGKKERKEEAEGCGNG